MRKRLLLIAYEMPPRWGPHALRIANIIKYLSQQGWAIDAIGCAPWNGLEDRSLSAMIPDEVEVRRVPQTTGGLLSGAKWTGRVVRCGMAIARRNRPDVILSSAPQYISHMAGYLLALRTGAAWVTDYGDPFTKHAQYHRVAVKQALTYAVEWLWMQRANRVVLVTEGAERIYWETFPRTKGRTAMIPLGYEPEDHFPISRPEASAEFRLGFAGSFHLGMSDGPAEFFRGVRLACTDEPALLEEMKVDLFLRSDVGTILRETLPEAFHAIFRVHSHVPDMQDLFRRLSQSDCTIVWGFRGGLQIPSKLYVYMGLRRPILGIVCDPADPMRGIIETHNRGPVVNNQGRDIADAILKLYRLHKNGELQAAYSREDVTEFTWPHLIGELGGVLNDVSREAGGKWRT